MTDPAAPEPRPDDEPLVLIVGEDSGLRAELNARLSEGYHVVEAEGAGDAAAMAARLQADLVVTDYTVSDHDAIRLLQTLRTDADRGGTPVILLSLGAPEAGDALGLATGLARLLTDWEPPVAARRPARASALSATDETFLADVVSTVRLRMSESAFGTGALALDLGMSPRQLRRRLVGIAGKTPAQLIRRVRLGAAAEMLLSGKRVKGVGAAVGFASTSGFRSAFRVRFGVAPAQYAASHRGMPPAEEAD